MSAILKNAKCEDLIEQYKAIDEKLRKIQHDAAIEKQRLYDYLTTNYVCAHFYIQADGEIWCDDLHTDLDCCGHFLCNHFKPKRRDKKGGKNKCKN